MNVEQRLEALQALTEVALRMRAPGDWYVDARMEIGGDGLLTGAHGNGRSPLDAVEDHWRQYVTDLPAGRYIVVYDGIERERRQYRWNGHRWAEVKREPRTA